MRDTNEIGSLDGLLIGFSTCGTGADHVISLIAPALCGLRRKIVAEPFAPGPENIQTVSFQSAIFQDRIFWARNFGGKLVRPGRLQIHLCTGQGEYLSRKFIPRTTPLGSRMV